MTSIRHFAACNPAQCTANGSDPGNTVTLRHQRPWGYRGAGGFSFCCL